MVAHAGNLAVFAAVAVLYALLAIAAYELFGALTIGVTFFPPAGLTFAALVVLPYRRWAAVIAAIVVAEVVVDLAEGQPIGLTLGWALANAVEPVVGALIARRMTSAIAFNARFAIAFLVGGLLAGPAAGATIGATNLAVERDLSWLDAFTDTWIGDALGVLVVAPLVIVLAGPIRIGRPAERREELWLGVLFLLVLVIAFWTIDDTVVGYIAIPLLAWAALRQGPLGLCVVAFVTAAAATTATAHERGPWGAHPTEDVAEQLREQQVFLLVAIGGAWVLALEVRRRVAAVQQVRDARADLELALAQGRLVDEVRRERDQAAALQMFTAGLTGAATVDEVETVVARHGHAVVRGALLELDVATAPFASNDVLEEDWSDSSAELPVRSNAGVLGVLHVRFTDLAAADDTIRTALRAVVQLVGQALERARLTDEERSRRLLLVAINEMLAALGGVTTVTGIAAAVERHGRDALDADAVVLALRHDVAEGLLVVRGVAGRHPARAGDEVSLDSDDPIAVAVRSGRATFVDEPGRPGDSGWWAVLPLTVGGQIVGALWFARSGPWSDPLRLRALSFASFVADALGRVQRAQADRRTALTLQQTLMPRHIPTVEHARVTGRYRPASGSLRVGGDWYEVIPARTGGTVMVIGDVVGHGVAAAGVMGQLSSAARALSLTTASPAELVSNLEVMASNTPGASMSTVVCAMYSPSDRTFSYCRAGHPPPLLRTVDGRVQLLDHDGGGPLCCGREGRSEATVQLEPGALLVLYTDGLIEWSGSSIETRIDELATAVAALSTTDPDVAVEMILDSMAPTADPQADDIALLCVVVTA